MFLSSALLYFTVNCGFGLYWFLIQLFSKPIFIKRNFAVSVHNIYADFDDGTEEKKHGTVPFF